ncbi:MAG: diphosphomevalonate decarboxylase [Pseudomonadota bacterium]
MTTAIAHPNIALIKYWGKQDRPGNLPASPNLSITLSELCTTTTVQDAERDEILLNNKAADDPKIAQFLQILRNRFALGPIKIESHNNFPTGAGLASSASGFAALTCALNQHCDWGLDATETSGWARQGSASAARSMQAGFVALVPPQWQAECVAPPAHWPLSTVVAITSQDKKQIDSGHGMELTRQTSPYFKRWVEDSGEDFAHAQAAIEARDFDALAAVAEHNCLKMHALMLTTVPTLAYWNPATVACMDVVRELRAGGTAAFFTIDAGPQVKVITQPQYSATVAAALRAVHGVLDVVVCGMGEGARVVDAA